MIDLVAPLSLEELLASGYLVPVDEKNKPFSVRHHIKFFDENLSYHNHIVDVSFNKLTITRTAEVDKNLNDVSPNLRKDIVLELVKHMDGYNKVFYILETRPGLFHGYVSSTVYYYIKGIKLC